MRDFLKEIVAEVNELLDSGYYNVNPEKTPRKKTSLKNAIIANRRHAVIAEFKLASPTRGRLTRKLGMREYIRSVENAGVIGLSVLTQPRHFNGSLNSLREAREQTQLPLIMKDFIVSTKQIEAAERSSADAVLLIQGIFDSNLSQTDETELVITAHDAGLEVLIEVNSSDELTNATNSDADIIGINHRNLRNLEIDMTLAERLLRDSEFNGKPTVAESGITGPEDARRLFQLGADAILVGSYLMQSEHATEAARMLVTANE